MVAAGGGYTVLLRSDGTAVASGNNDDGQCTMPPLDGELTYTQVAAGAGHMVLLMSDGTAVASGNNEYGQCLIPPLDGELTYTQVAAGRGHTVLLRSDGTAVASGRNDYGQCTIPPLDGELTYMQTMRRHRVILQGTFWKLTDSAVLQLCFLSGDEHSQVSIRPTDIISDLLARLGRDLGNQCLPDVLLPNGELLSKKKSATFAPFFSGQCNPPTAEGLSAAKRRKV